jgi:hypothetical protein
MRYESHSKTEGTGDWEPIVAPFPCTYYAIYGKGVLFDKCSDPDDGDTCLPQISDFMIIAPPLRFRWNAGDVITYVRSASPLCLYFLR